MKTQGLLDQLLKTAQNSLGGGGGLEGLLGGGKPPARYEEKKEEKRGLLNADFGKGALAGGALGLLLGNKKMRKMGGKLALYGGVAAVGVLAYKAYGAYRKQQGGSAVEPQTVDRLPPPQAELHSQAILKALVAAAKADGHIDEREREVIEGEFTRIDNDPTLRQWLHAELEKPLDPAEVARAASTPEMASEMYLASLLAADEQSFMERAYLDELARQLKIDDALKAQLEAQLKDARGG
ncbi:tellurite resistance TerB family protein [Lysobacter sp. 5GHs7-4]|uniref:tellurite resistance TerB family protein n=1 Tax=Lysobacter sp. 5GHs7-4 TaxID=2904253 RepID=UPI001E656E65|nr:tellurite resistance TerB family protein [Lysobacter sp. 5GHs7-4]UHQ22287.1 tellurite resistance TerB family protein [Lysobacter sp. 5GHs7-4]